MAKVKEVDPEIMSSSLGELVRKQEEREWNGGKMEEERKWKRRKEMEEREWIRQMLEQCTSAIQQQQNWQKEVVGLLKQQNPLI